MSSRPLKSEVAGTKTLLKDYGTSGQSSLFVDKRNVEKKEELSKFGK